MGFFELLFGQKNLDSSLTQPLFTAVNNFGNNTFVNLASTSLRLVLCMRNDDRRHTHLFDSLSKQEDPTNVTAVQISEMMFGTTPTKCQSTGLKVYYIPQEDKERVVMIKLFSVDLIIPSTSGSAPARLPCRNQFALAAVISSSYPPSPHSSPTHRDEADEDLSNESNLLLYYSSFFESQIDEAIITCKNSLYPHLQISIMQSPKAVMTTQIIILPQHALQNDEGLISATKNFQEKLITFFQPVVSIKPFFEIMNYKVVPISELFLQDKFFSTLGELLNLWDIPQTNFLVSSMVTAILTYHCSWLQTLVMPHIPETTSSEAYYAMMDSMFGRCGKSKRYCRFVFLGNKNDELHKLCSIASYFIRSGHFLEHGYNLHEEFMSEESLNPVPASVSLDNDKDATSTYHNVRLPEYEPTPWRCFPESYHCYSSMTSPNVISPFVVVPIQNSQSNHPILELPDEQLSLFCSIPFIPFQRHMKNSNNKENDESNSADYEVCCVVVNTVTRVCYMAKRSESNEIIRERVMPSNVIQQTLHQLCVWKKHRMNDASLFTYLDSKLFEIYQHSQVVMAVLENPTPENTSLPYLAKLLRVSVSHINLILSIMDCVKPEISKLVTRPPVVPYVPTYRLELSTLVESVF